MDEADAAALAESVAVLRQAGARFAYLHGSRAAGTEHPGSDIDIAAYFGGRAPASFEILLPPGVDLLVLDHAPLRRITDDLAVLKQERHGDVTVMYKKAGTCWS
jgi:predicted nucleotidyltransferase